ncbi:MAG: TolC family protein [bacterium]
MKLQYSVFALIMAVLCGAAVRSQVVSQADTREPTSLTLEECIETGLARNPQIGRAEAKVDEAEAKVKQARSNLYPSLEFSANAVRSNQLPEFKTTEPQYIPTTMPMANPSGGLVPGLPAHIHMLPFPGFEMSNTREGDIYGAKVEARYPLYTGNKIRNGVKSAELQERVEKENLRQAKNELVFNIQQAFSGVLLAQRMVKVVEDSYRTAEAHYRQVQALYQEGLASNLDVLQVESVLADLEPQRIEAGNGVKKARLYLNNLLNIELETAVRAKGELEYEPHDLPVAEDIYATALEHRPEMRTLRLRRKMARKMVEIAEANAYPNVSLFANYSWDRGQEMPPNNDIWRDGYQAGVAVSVPLFDGGETQGKVAEARAMLRQVEKGMQALELGIKTQVEEALLDLDAARKKVKAREASVEASEKNYDVARTRYAVGLATNVEVMDAHSQLTRARAERLQAVYDHKLAWIKLKSALGVPEEDKIQ